VSADHLSKLRFLVDEDLSPKIAEGQRTLDHVDAIHLRERGKLGLSDAQLLDFAFAEDRVLITADVIDFEKLAATRELHTGILLLAEGALLRAQQIEAVRAAIKTIGKRRLDLINRAIVIDAKGKLGA
jgi:predicted nuclease of predicted toxin-antitoxin system